MVYIKKLLKSFSQAQEGVVAIIVAIALVAILFGVLSLSIDLNRTQTSYTHNYNATDAAALAGAEMWLQGKIDSIGKVEKPLEFKPDEDEMTEYAKKVLKQNFERDQNSSVFLDDSTFVVTMDEEKRGQGKTRYTVKVDACAQLDTPIANVPKHMQDSENPGKAKTCTSSTAGFDLGKLENVEVAFALDFTESMYWRGPNQGCPPGGSNPNCPVFEETKAFALQRAMEYVFDEYFDSTNEASTAYASIVPYTSFVNVYPYDSKGVVNQRFDTMNFNGKQFYATGDASTGYGLENADNAFTDFRTGKMSKTTGENSKSKDLESFIFDPAFHGGGYYGFAPFYTSKNNKDTTYQTENYSYILNRVPTFDSDKLDTITKNPRNIRYLPFTNYHDLVDDIDTKDFVKDPTLSGNTCFKYDENDKCIYVPKNPNDQYAKMICGQYTIAAAADERIEKVFNAGDGSLRSSPFAAKFNGNGHGIELHESFPIQPLTNDAAVLNMVLERYTSRERLYPRSWVAEENDNQVVDFQGERIDKARIGSIVHKTSSIQGLMWAWFTINNAWQGIWDRDSVTESYVGSDASVRNDSDNQLPSEKNFKHIILISDGYDNDGCMDLSGGTADANIGRPLGRLNSCDAYTPIEAVSDEQYNELCTAIKTNGTTDNSNDDVTIHTVMLDYDAGLGAVNDGYCDKLGGDNNRFAQCSSPGEYYNDVRPAELQEMFDNIFAGILTDAVPVRLIK